MFLLADNNTISNYKTDDIELYFDHYSAKYIHANYVELYRIVIKRNYNDIILYLPNKVIYKTQKIKPIFSIRFGKKLFHHDYYAYSKNIKQIILSNKILTKLENNKWKLN